MNGVVNGALLLEYHTSQIKQDLVAFNLKQRANMLENMVTIMTN